MPTKTVKRRTPAKRTSIVARRKPTVKPVKKTKVSARVRKPVIKAKGKTKSSVKKTPLLLRPLKHLRSRGFVKLPNKRKKWMVPTAFAVIFGAIGCYFLFVSFASTPVLEGYAGEFTVLRQARVGNPAITANSAQTIPVLGKGGVPTSNVRSVLLTVTVNNPTADSELTFYPNGTARPSGSSMSVTAGKSATAQVLVNVGAGGAILMYNSAGSASTIVDVSGYYQDVNGKIGTRFNSMPPVRALDTRTGQGIETGAGQVAANGTLTLHIGKTPGVPANAVSVVMNVTSSLSTQKGTLTMWTTGTAQPKTANVSFSGGQTVSNQVTMRITAGGNRSLQIYNASAGTTDVVVEIVGYYTPVQKGYEKTQEGRFIGINSTRLVSKQKLAGGATLSPAVTGYAGVPPTKIRAVVLNLAVHKPSSYGSLSVSPAGKQDPYSNKLFYEAGESLSNMVTVPVSSDGKIDIRNNHFDVDLTADVVGYYLDTYDGYEVASTSFGLPSEIQYDYSGGTGAKQSSFNFKINQSRDFTAASIYMDRLSYSVASQESTFYCSSTYEQCKPTGKATQVAQPMEGSTMYSIKVPLANNTVYTFNKELRTDQPGFAGTWIFATLSGPGIGSVELFATKPLDGSGYPIYLSDSQYISTSAYMNGCKDEPNFTLTITGRRVNSQTIPIKTPWIHTYNSGRCPGISVANYQNGGTDRATILARVGIPVSERSRYVRPPTITNFAQSEKNVVLEVTDDVAITNWWVVLETGAGPVYSPYAYSDTCNGYTHTYIRQFGCKLTFDQYSYEQLAAGTYTVRATVRDNAGNETIKTLQYVKP